MRKRPGSGNPVLDELDALSPPAQNALRDAHELIKSVPTSGAAPVATAAPAAPSGPQPLIKPVAPSPQMQGQQAEVARLQTSPSGISQIKNPYARTGLQILDAVGGGLLPGIEQRIPGTQGHHDVLLHQAQGNVKQYGDQMNDEQKRELEAAQATEQASLPALNEAKNETAILRAGEPSRAAQIRADATRDVAKTKAAQAAQAVNLHSAESGFEAVVGPDGETVTYQPIPRERLSPQAQAKLADTEALTAYRGAQSELAAAEQSYKEAQAKAVPEQTSLAYQRLLSAQQSHEIAKRRLNLSEKQTEARLHGTEGGAPLPGAIETETGTPVGTAFQSNVRPTGTQRNKADLANSAAEQIGDIKSIVKTRPDIFGPAAGRTTDFTVWLGSQDPDAQRFRSARTIAADHLAGVFGGRSEAALQALDSAIGRFKDNPAAIEAGLDQVVKGNSVFQKSGTPRTVGGAHDVNAPAGGVVKWTRDKDGNPVKVK